MTPSQIRAWQASPDSSRASLRVRSTTGRGARSELSQIVTMLRTPGARWSASDCQKARDLVAFVKRHRAQMGSRCQPRRVRALKNWGYAPPRCS